MRKERQKESNFESPLEDQLGLGRVISANSSRIIEFALEDQFSSRRVIAVISSKFEFYLKEINENGCQEFQITCTKTWTHI